MVVASCRVSSNCTTIKMASYMIQLRIRMSHVTVTCMCIMCGVVRCGVGVHQYVGKCNDGGVQM